MSPLAHVTTTTTKTTTITPVSPLTGQREREREMPISRNARFVHVACDVVVRGVNTDHAHYDFCTHRATAATWLTRHLVAPCLSACLCVIRVYL